MRDLRNSSIIIRVDVQPIRVVIHRHHTVSLEDSVLFWQVRLRESGLIMRITNLLPHQLIHPLLSLVATGGIGDDERHIGSLSSS